MVIDCYNKKISINYEYSTKELKIENNRLNELKVNKYSKI